MPEQFYFIPSTQPPYDVVNNHRPLYLHELRVNHICKDIPALNMFVCRVNTTDVIHADIASRPGVRQLPAGLTWDTVINTMQNPHQNFISGLCVELGIPFDVSETLGELLNRIILSSDLSFGELPVTTQYNVLTTGQQNALSNFCTKWNKQAPGANETIKNMASRLSKTIWNGSISVPE